MIYKIKLTLWTF